VSCTEIILIIALAGSWIYFGMLLVARNSFWSRKVTWLAGDLKRCSDDSSESYTRFIVEREKARMAEAQLRKIQRNIVRTLKRIEGGE